MKTAFFILLAFGGKASLAETQLPEKPKVGLEVTAQTTFQDRVSEIQKLSLAVHNLLNSPSPTQAQLSKAITDYQKLCYGIELQHLYTQAIEKAPAKNLNLLEKNKDTANDSCKITADYLVKIEDLISPKTTSNTSNELYDQLQKKFTEAANNKNVLFEIQKALKKTNSNNQKTRSSLSERFRSYSFFSCDTKEVTEMMKSYLKFKKNIRSIKEDFEKYEYSCRRLEKLKGQVEELLSEASLDAPPVSKAPGAR